MTVRAKFKVDSIERSATNLYDPATGNSSVGEIQTVKLSPVYGNNDPQHENSKFWKYTPCGQISLGTINADAGSYFSLGGEYYIDFTKAE